MTITLQLGISVILAGLPNPFDFLRIQTAFTVPSFLNVISGWTDFNRATFLLHYTLDFFYPWMYSFFLFFLLEDLASLGRFKFLAPLAGLCDELENLLHMLLINRNLEITGSPVFFGAFFASLKWLLLLGLTLLILAHLGQRFKNRAQLR